MNTAVINVILLDESMEVSCVKNGGMWSIQFKAGHNLIVMDYRGRDVKAGLRALVSELEAVLDET